MIELLIAIGVLGGLGGVLAAGLALAAKVFAVEEDPRLPLLIEALPGANCGGCGFAGCAAYAQAVLDDPTAIGACPVGGEEAVDELSLIMGVEPSTTTVRKVAFVRCSGQGREHLRYAYEGMSDCLAASRVTGGGAMACTYGCLGLGTCVKACPFDAIHVAQGVAVVDKEACKACNRCIDICPRSLIELVPYGAAVAVSCGGKDKGVVTRKNCESGCIGCALCVKACPSEAITVSDNLAHIEYDKCIACGKCAEVCPRGIILKAVTV